MSALSPVERQAREVMAAFDQAATGLEDRLRKVIADHAVKGMLQSGATVRKFADAFEAEARGASAQLVDTQTAAKRSPVLRTKLAEAVERGIQHLEDTTEARLRRIGLSDETARTHLRERRQGIASPQEATRPKRAGAFLPWARKIGLTSARGLMKWALGAAGALVVASVSKVLGLT